MKRNFNQLEKESTTSNYKAVNLAKARALKQVKNNYFIKFPQGYKLTKNDKQHILHIFYQLKNNKSFKSLANADIHKLTALLYGCSHMTVRKVIAHDGEYTDRRKNRNIHLKEIPENYRQRFLFEIKHCSEAGKIATTKNFQKILRENGIEVSDLTIMRRLKQWGLRWGHLQERDSRRRNKNILKLRENYLLKLSEFEEAGFVNRIYLDESYLHENHSLSFGWYSPDRKELHKPSGLGRRIVLEGAVSLKGWLGVDYEKMNDYLSLKNNNIHSHAGIKYWAIKKSDKETANVTRDIFHNYFRENVLQKLDCPSLIILDNAKYHIWFESDILIPSQTHKKGVLKKYLQDNNQEVEEKATKGELLTQAKEYFKNHKPKTVIETEAEAVGHRVLFLPPYHPELSPIEFCWAKVKKYAAQNPPFSVNDLCDKVIPQALCSLTPQMAENIYNHVKSIEELYRKTIIQDQLSLLEKVHQMEKLFQIEENLTDSNEPIVPTLSRMLSVPEEDQVDLAKKAAEMQELFNSFSNVSFSSDDFQLKKADKSASKSDFILNQPNKISQPNDKLQDKEKKVLGNLLDDLDVHYDLPYHSSSDFDYEVSSEEDSESSISSIYNEDEVFEIS